MADRLVLQDASGPVPPRFSFTTTMTITRTDDGAAFVRDHRDASGVLHDERKLDAAAWDALVTAITAVVPLGETLDLVGERRHQKGVSVNHVELTVGDRTARLDYFSSHLDEDDGDPRARAIVTAVRSAVR